MSPQTIWASEFWDQAGNAWMFCASRWSNLGHYSLRCASEGRAERCRVFVNSASGWGNAWRPRATARASTIPSGIGKSLQFPSRLSDLPWLHVAASDLRRRPSPDMEDWRLSMRKPLLIQHTRLRTLCSWIIILTPSMSSIWWNQVYFGIKINQGCEVWFFMLRNTSVELVFFWCCM